VDQEWLRIVVSGEIRADCVALHALIEQGFRGIDASGVEVRVERSARSWDSFTGRAYPEPPSRPRAHPATKYLIRIRLPSVLRNRGYPQSYRYPRLKTAPSITVRDWRERLLALVAHEAFHVHQFRGGLRRSEVAAERWAQEVLLRSRGDPAEGGEPEHMQRPGRLEQLALFEQTAAAARPSVHVKA
jgi:hypothetical protein